MTPPTNVKLLEPIEAEYIESGTFVASEECTYEYGVKPGDKVCVITPNVWATLHAQLEAAKGAVTELKACRDVVDGMHGERQPAVPPPEPTDADWEVVLLIEHADRALALCASAGLTNNQKST